MKTVEVAVQRDHLQRLTQGGNPVTAIAELIWNGLDADADEVSVEFGRNILGGLETIRVVDNGHGMTDEEVEQGFGKLGGSWKRTAGRTKKEGRIVHGKDGKGRFRAFGLGHSVAWDSVAERNGVHERLVVTSNIDELGRFRIEDPREVGDEETGTSVIVNQIREKLPEIDTNDFAEELAEEFALYLRKYPHVVILYGGRKLDPSRFEDQVTDYALPEMDLDGEEVADVVVTVVEWRRPTTRSIYLCDADGFTITRVAPHIHAPGFHYTVYVKSHFLRKLEDENLLDLIELKPGPKQLLEVVKNQLRDHFRQRAAEKAREVVELWKEEEIYPYEGEPATPIERAERQVFDVVAINVASYVPRFDETDRASKQLSFRLLRQALEENPKTLRKILGDVLGLPKERLDELARLLDRTSLTAVIAAAKEVADRLDFLRGLEILLFRPGTKEELLERSQLHRILASETWVFGEQFYLSVDDQSLTEVLRKHLDILRRETDETKANNIIEADLPEVLRGDGSRGIIDLMMSRRIPQPNQRRREHLVVELKRPTQVINMAITTQARSYLYAISRDERFSHTDTVWNFWAISNRVTEQVVIEMEDKEAGLLKTYSDPLMRIYVRTWAEVLEECRARLTFFQDHLKYTPDDESALTYLNQTHAKYLPDSLYDGSDNGTNEDDED